MAFSTFTMLCNHRLYLVPEHFMPPKGNPVPIKKPLLNPPLGASDFNPFLAMPMSLTCICKYQFREMDTQSETWHMWYGRQCGHRCPSKALKMCDSTFTVIPQKHSLGSTLDAQPQGISLTNHRRVLIKSLNTRGQTGIYWCGKRASTEKSWVQYGCIVAEKREKIWNERDHHVAPVISVHSFFFIKFIF